MSGKVAIQLFWVNLCLNDTWCENARKHIFGSQNGISNCKYIYQSLQLGFLIKKCFSFMELSKALSDQSGVELIKIIHQNIFEVKKNSILLKSIIKNLFAPAVLI